MKLYYLPGAPSPNRVRLYLAEKNFASPIVQVEQIDLSGGLHRKPSHLARNSLGKVPVLEIGVDKFIHESLAIIEYLEEIFPDPPLIGRTAYEKAAPRATERVAEMRVFYPLARYVQAAGMNPSRFPDPAIAPHYRAQFPIGLQYLNNQLGHGGSFLMGDEFSIADCTLAAVIDFALRHGVGVLEEYSRLASWYMWFALGIRRPESWVEVGCSRPEEDIERINVWGFQRIRSSPWSRCVWPVTLLPTWSRCT